jgi:hypothetical protein
MDCVVRRFSITSGQDRRERIRRDRQLLDVGGVAGGVTDAIFFGYRHSVFIKRPKKQGAAERHQARKRRQFCLHTACVSELYAVGGPGVACQGRRGINEASLHQVSEDQSSDSVRGM